MGNICRYQTTIKQRKSRTACTFLSFFGYTPPADSLPTPDTISKYLNQWDISPDEHYWDYCSDILSFHSSYCNIKCLQMKFTGLFSRFKIDRPFRVSAGNFQLGCLGDMSLSWQCRHMNIMPYKITYNWTLCSTFCSGPKETKKHESALTYDQWYRKIPCHDVIVYLISLLPEMSMMTSSNGKIFRATGHLCGEFTGPQWIHHTKASDAELWCLHWSAPE